MSVLPSALGEAPTRRTAPTNRGDGGHDLSQLELVQDGGLAGRVKAHLRGEQREAASPGRPAATRAPDEPAVLTMRIRISFLAISRDSSLLIVRPIVGTRRGRLGVERVCYK